jgi:hypothetical protein
MAKNHPSAMLARFLSRAQKIPNLSVEEILDTSEIRRKTLAEVAGALGHANFGLSLLSSYAEDTHELQRMFEIGQLTREDALMPPADSWAHGTPVTLYTHKEIGPHFNAQGAPISTSGAALLTMRNEEAPNTCDIKAEKYRRYLLDKIIKRNTAKAPTP